MKTLQEALTLVPTYWPLVPGMDKWKEGDEYRLIGGDLGWRPGDYTDLTGAISGKYEARRFIPQSVREAEAIWAIISQLINESFLYEPEPKTGGNIYQIVIDLTSDPAFYAIGAAKLSAAITDGPGALWRWVEENRK